MSLPDWLEPLYEAAEMRAADEWAIEQRGIPGLDLMERAGVGLARATAAVARPGPVRVVCGKGNNGGDGLVAARRLREEGREVDVLAVGDLSETKGDARANLDRLPGDPPRPFDRKRSKVRPRSSTPCSVRGSRARRASPWRARSARSTTPGRGGRLRRPVRRQRVDRRGRGGRRAGGRTATFHGPKIGLWTWIPARGTRGGSR